jgi:hypothetical protein
MVTWTSRELETPGAQRPEGRGSGRKPDVVLQCGIAS